MADYQPAQVGYFLGNCETFSFTPETDTAPNSIITRGKLIGVTRFMVKAGEKGSAFLTSKFSVYHFELPAAAESETAAGTEVYVTSSGSVSLTSSEGSPIGCLYEKIAIGETFAQVMLYPPQN